MKDALRSMFLALGLITVSMLMAPPAHAQPYEAVMSTGYIGYGKNSSQFNIGPGLFYQPMPSWGWLQLGGEITYQKLSQRGGSTKSLLFMVGPNFNLNGSVLTDAFFVSAGLVVKSGSSDFENIADEDPNGTGFYLLFGKRISLGGTWSVRPSVGMVNAGNSTLILRPFAVSYQF